MNDVATTDEGTVAGSLTTNTVLRRVEGLSISFDAEGSTVVDLPGGENVSAGPFGLAVLDVFADPVTLTRASEEIQRRVRGPEGYMQALDTLYHFVLHGVLLSEEGFVVQPLPAAEQGYAHPSAHRVMLDDRPRTEAFLQAIHDVVRPGDVVIDIGTGSGVLAVAAAMAGASRVYALEASGIANVARAVFEANGVADRVTLVQGWSTRVDLPEPGDVFVSEMLGNDPLDERLLEIVLDARDRLLKPGARIIPCGLKVVARLFRLPADQVDTMRVTSKSVDDWRAWFGIEFGPLLDVARETPRQTMPRSDRCVGWETVGDPMVLDDIDFASFRGAQVDASASVTFDREVIVDGAVLSFVVELAEGISLTTDPYDPSRATHWRNQVVALGESEVVRAGGSVSVTYRHRVAGRRDGLDLVLPAG